MSTTQFVYKVLTLFSVLDREISMAYFLKYILKLLKHFSVYNVQNEKEPKMITQSKSNIELSRSLMRFTKNQLHVIIVFITFQVFLQTQ